MVNTTATRVYASMRHGSYRAWITAAMVTPPLSIVSAPMNCE